MKWIKTFKIFESLKDQVDLDEIEDRLVDFKHLGFDVVVSLSSSMILDFDKKMQDADQSYRRKENKFHIKSSEIDNYNSGVSHDTLTIGMRHNSGGDYTNLSINEITSVYDDFSYYLKQVYDLKPNYINIGSLSLKTITGAYTGQFLYFKDFQSIREFLQAKDATDLDNLQVTGFNLGFYK